LTGAWVAILFIENDKKQLSGLEENTTHNRMELTAVIKAIEFLQHHYKPVFQLTIYTDSQYVTRLPARKDRLNTSGFTSKKGKALPNTDLVKRLLDLYELYTIKTVKIKAHQKLNSFNEFNIEADLLSRKMIRGAIKK
jgi:ribonuclease HI